MLCKWFYSKNILESSQVFRSLEHQNSWKETDMSNQMVTWRALVKLNGSQNGAKVMNMAKDWWGEECWQR